MYKKIKDAINKGYEFNKLNKKVEDKATSIKINEVHNMLTVLSKTDRIDNNDMTNLLHYYELLAELYKIHG
jgi:hypothetical protein